MKGSFIMPNDRKEKTCEYTRKISSLHYPRKPSFHNPTKPKYKSIL